MDSFLITVVVIIIAALSNWLQQRAQARQDEPREPGTPRIPPPSPPRESGMPPRPASWPAVGTMLERELRRLTGELTPAPGTPPPLRPRPSVTVRPKETPSGSPLHPVVVAPPVHKLPVPAPSAVVVVAEATPALLTQSDTGYKHAQQLHQTVADRLRQVDQQTVQHRPERRSGASAAAVPIAATIRALRRNPAAARQAFVASLVFGAPKSLEE